MFRLVTIFQFNFRKIIISFCFAGKQIEKDPSIDRLIEIRTVLEKIRPIDYKLRYQIDKLVKTAITGTSSSTDPNSFKVYNFFVQKTKIFIHIYDCEFNFLAKSEQYDFTVAR